MVTETAAPSLVQQSEMMNDVVDIIEVLPDEALDPRVLGDGLVSPFWGLIAGHGTTDGCIIKEWLSNIRDFRF